MTAYVVIVSEYDYDSSYSNRLIGCATFSTLDLAKAYVKRKAEIACKNLAIDESEIDYDIYGNAHVFDNDVYDDAIQLKIIKSNVDEYKKI